MPKGKPNILVICDDGIGVSNVVRPTRVLMRRQTPGIDRLAQHRDSLSFDGALAVISAASSH